MSDQFEAPEPLDSTEPARPGSRAEKIIGYTVLLLVIIGFLLFFTLLLPHLAFSIHFH
jgi:hypothetical protein